MARVDLEIQRLRIDAIDAYAGLEVRISALFSVLVASEHDTVPATIFYRITSTRTRYAIMGDVIRTTHPKYRKAWQKIEKWLGPIDRTRNSIVHWWVSVRNKGDGPYETSLDNPRSEFNPLSPSETLTNKDISQFIEQIGVMDDIIHALLGCLLEDEPPPFDEIFLRPQGYQSPEEFLQRLKHAAH